MYPLVYESTFYAVVLSVAMAVWYVPETIGSFFQRSGKTTSPQDRGSYWVLIGGLWVGLFVAFWVAGACPQAAIRHERHVLFWSGIALVLAGTAFRWYAIRVLGRSFTRDVAVRTEQRIVQGGPYHWIRHPAYTGTMLTMLGVGLALNNWLSVLAAVLGWLVGHYYRVMVEEQALTAILGRPYYEYMRHTRRFIPFVW